MNTEEVKSCINKILSNEFGIDEENITDDLEIKTDLAADSLDIAEILMEFEDRFKIKIPDNDALTLITVRDIYTYVIDRLSELEKKSS